MAEMHSPRSSTPERRPARVSSSLSSSNELAPAGPSELQLAFSSPSSLSSAMVPVRLDVLYFLLSSAFRGAPHAFPLTPAHGGQGSLSTCCGPAPQLAASCCSCHSARQGMVGCAAIQQPSGIQQEGRPHGGYGDHGWSSDGVTRSRNNGHCWGGAFQRSEGDNSSGASQPSSARRWRRPQSPMDWQENQRKERGRGGGQGNRDNWPSRQQSFQRSWGERRQGSADSEPWKSRFQDLGSEALSLGSNSSNGKRSHWQEPHGGPDAKRRSDGAGMIWQTDQQVKPSQTCVGDTADAARPSQTGVQDSEEDWEADYESGQATPSAPGTLPLSSQQGDQADASKAGQDLDDGCPEGALLPKQRLATSPLPDVATKDQEAAVVGKAPAASHVDRSLNDGFTSYLRNLYSDPPGKSSSEGSSDLVIDTDVESLKPEEE